MVHCSLGHDTTRIINKPQWWPQDVKFSSPLIRPKKINDVSCLLLLDNIIISYISTSLAMKYYTGYLIVDDTYQLSVVSSRH